MSEIDRLAKFIASQVDTLSMVTCRALAEDIADAGFLKSYTRDGEAPESITAKCLAISTEGK